MRKLAFTLYANCYAKQGEEAMLPWPEWVKVLSTHAVRGNISDTDSKNRLDAAKDGPAFILGVLKPGQTRSKKNVARINAMALDIDDCDDDGIRAAQEALSGIEYFLYTTHKHGSYVAAGLDRLRIILPLDKPLLPQHYARAWRNLNALVGGVNDSATKDISRLHYLPSTFDLTKAKNYHSPGRWLTPEDLLSTKEPSILEKTKRRLKAIKNDDPLADAARRLAKGQPFADEGSRHSTALALTQWIGYRYQGLTDVDLRNLFEKSLSVMPDFPFEDVYRTYTDMVSKISKKRSELQSDTARYDYSDKDLQAIYEEQPEWSKEVFDKIATEQGWETINEIRKRWVVQRDGICWFLQQNGTYSPAVSSKDIPLAISKYMGPTPVPTVTITEKGPKQINRDLLFSKHASLASRVVADLTQQYTIYNPDTETLSEAVCPLRKDLKPVYTKRIDTWLQKLAGKNYEKVLDWLAIAPDLNQILCALYFDGAPDAGKTLFAFGVAHLWTDGPPADIAEILHFNEELIRCPVILADEELPKSKDQDITAQLRSMLSTTSRSLKRKFRPPAELIGAVRLILTANNEFLLKPPSVTTRYDTQAIAERFLEIEATPAASSYLSTVPKEERKRWGFVGIAEHALWLQENRVIVDNGKRFAVEGNIGKMHRGLTTRTKWNAFCYEWIVNYLMSDTPVQDVINGFIICKDCDLYVCNHALIHGWRFHLNTQEDPSTAKINAALRAISDDDRKQFRRRNKRYKFYKIDLSFLYAWSETESIGDKEAIEARIRRESLKLAAPETPSPALPQIPASAPEQCKDALGIFDILKSK